jgi:riboflavin transporter FmnP
MSYFNSRELMAISILAALWAVFNWLVSPIFWELTHLPILCDMIGVTILILTLWWTRKPGAGATMGLIATLLNFIFRPGAFQFLGFTVACIFFDVTSSLIGYRKILDKGLPSSISLLVLSVVSTTIAGFIIGNFFMNPGFLSNAFGGVLVFAAIHGGGGLIGGVLGVVIIRGLESRHVIPRAV